MEFIDIPLPNRTEGPRDESISMQINYFPCGAYYEAELQKTVAYLKELTKSDGFIIYKYDDILHELYVCPVGDDDETCFPMRYKWNIHNGNTVACYALKKMAPILIDHDTSININYPYLQDITYLCPRYVMCIPIINFQKRTLGVVEFYRQEGLQYNPIEVRLCMFLIKNCAEAYKQNENTVFYKAYNNIQDVVQGMIESHADKNNDEDSYIFLQKVIQLAQKYTRSSTSTLFLEKEGRFRNIVTAGNEGSVSAERPYGLGFIIRSKTAIEFFAHILHHKIHGMIRVANKIGHSEFCVLDKQILAGIAKMCTLWAVTEFQSGYIKKQKGLMKTLKKIINFQLKFCVNGGHRLGDVEHSNLKQLNSWKYSINGECDDKKFAIDVVVMMSQVMKNLKVPENALKEFVVMIKLCHGTTEYNTFKYTVMVVQSLYCLLKSSKEAVEGNFALTMMIATLCGNILVDESPTAKSSVFGRYNKYPYELMRFEVVKYFIEKTKLFYDYSQRIQDDLLENIKLYMICTNLLKLKKNMTYFNQNVLGDDPVALQQDATIRKIMYRILPGLARLLCNFRTDEFLQMFPNFFLTKRLSDHNISYVEILLALKFSY